MPYAHISFDDCIFWTDLIGGRCASAFDQPLLGALEQLHARFGAVFTLNLFMQARGHSVKELTNTYARELLACRGWLRFAFHAKDEATHYDEDQPAAIRADYDAFTKAVLTLTGSPASIDRMPRLGFFSGSLENVRAIRDTEHGIKGLLTTDDTRLSYYFDSAQNDHMLQSGLMHDTSERLWLLKSQRRLERLDASTLDGLTPKTHLEFFTHENVWTGAAVDTTLRVCQWLQANGYTYCFWEDVL